MHRRHVETLLADAAVAHEALLGELSPELAASLPVDATGVTEAIDHLGAAAGLTAAERRDLIRPHGVNPAVLHARVFGRAPLTAGTVLASYVDGARVRAAALQRVASDDMRARAASIASACDKACATAALVLAGRMPRRR